MTVSRVRLFSCSFAFDSEVDDDKTATKVLLQEVGKAIKPQTRLSSVSTAASFRTVADFTAFPLLPALRK